MKSLVKKVENNVFLSVPLGDGPLGATKVDWYIVGGSSYVLVCNLAGDQIAPEFGVFADRKLSAVPA